ncbi:class I SAM-dependent methyltransferase [Azospirillum sp. B4]|uniref:class I SAM-dependent methyltransferase n=1 Tax=Azospirillum sp. B4 TaxID=95605 RepID=UPI0003490DE7|nr:class I SAM-dependent methyltransferase [Azospirillum sp. B4]
MTEQSLAANDTAPHTGTTLGKAFWHRYFNIYDTLNESVTYRDLVAENIDLTGMRPGQHVLDAGTGTGNIALELLRRGAKVTGTDYLESALDLCRKKAPEATFLFADLTKPLPFPDDSFDHAICVNVIHLLDEPSRALAVAELRRVVRPGGRVVVTVFGVGFRSLAVYWQTLRRNSQELGLVNTILRGLRLTLTTLRIFYYVSRISRTHDRHKYMTEGEVRGLFADAGLTHLTIHRVFAGQCWVGAGTK